MGTCREDEDHRALDVKEAFEFDVSEGEIMGPSKERTTVVTRDLDPDLRRYMNAQDRNTVIFPKVKSKAPTHHDAERFEPTKVKITFKPERNELYKCRFRIQIDGGKAMDFICRGCGSYDESDDIMELREA